MNSIQSLHSLGQSIWYDNIQRKLLENGELAGMIERDEIRGVTSNPSIFQNAMTKSTDYDSALKPMAWAGWSAEQIFWQLAVEDIQSAADLFLPLYERSKGLDGYVSLEVNPFLAEDTQGTIREAQALWARVNRPNLMIKIPATRAGLPAVRKVISEGINVNVTLIFSLDRYREVMDAYLSGLEDRAAAGKSIAGIASVASFFVSRVDTKTDAYLQKRIDADPTIKEQATALMGKAAIANARLAYALFEQEFSSARFTPLKSKGAAVQRPLWASTSTKNPAYRDVIYVEDLIGPQSVNTVPPKTLTAFGDHGKAAFTIKNDMDEAQGLFDRLSGLGISIDQVTEELEVEGVKAFADAFRDLIQSIDVKRLNVLNELGTLKEGVQKRVADLENKSVIRALFENNPDAWNLLPAGREEFMKRSGWLNSPWKSEEFLGDLQQFVDECWEKGFRQVLLLGMGGSSLAPEVLSRVKKAMLPANRGMDLEILDSTDPAQVQAAFERFPFESTLFIAASKSGTTSEIIAYINFFWARAVEKLGNTAGEHFAVITDAGTALEKMAVERKFLRVFHGDSKVGGRFSALTVFGMVPAALAGLDTEKILSSAKKTAEQCSSERALACNPGAVLGAIMGEAWSQGRDKLTIIADPCISSFGSWMEQLVAESSGKSGKGIVPVDIEPESTADAYSKDRLFVYMRVDGSRDDFVASLSKSGQPVLQFGLPEVHEIGGWFYLWEIAITTACAVMQVNPFDQPDVQDNKTRTQKKIQDKLAGINSTPMEPSLDLGEVKFFGATAKETRSISSARATLISTVKKMVKTGDYIAINAYLPRNEKTLADLQQLRSDILAQTGNATTLGFGPRFLHSTGQLHKGGANNGVFIQITATPEADVEIPTEDISFGFLESAQADGDLEALKARGRRAIRVQLAKPDAGLLLK